MYTVLLVSYSDFFDGPGEVPVMFKKAGDSVVVFCCETSWLRSNKFHDEWISASKDKTEFCKEFIKHVQQHGDRYQKIVLLDDITINHVHEALPEGDDVLFKKIMPITKLESKGILASKLGMSQVFAQNQITTPRYASFNSKTSIEEIKQQVNFPVLLKVDFSFSGIGIRKCEAPEELQRTLGELHDTENVIVQEFITGDDIGVEALFEKGKLVMYQCAHVEEYMGNEFSITTQRTYFRNKKVEKLLIELGEKLGLNSFASIGYIYHKSSDTYYLIEVDPRTNGWMPFSRFTDHNFVDALKSVATGIPLPKRPVDDDETKSYKIIHFDRDLRRCFKYKDYKGLFRWLFNYKGRWKFIPIYDSIYFGRIMKKMIMDLLKIKY